MENISYQTIKQLRGVLKLNWKRKQGLIWTNIDFTKRKTL